MPDVELYWGPGSCARVPFIALEEAGADFTLHVINRFAGDAKSPEYLAVNPKGTDIKPIAIDAVTGAEIGTRGFRAVRPE